MFSGWQLLDFGFWSLVLIFFVALSLLVIELVVN